MSKGFRNYKLTLTLDGETEDFTGDIHGELGSKLDDTLRDAVGRNAKTLFNSIESKRK